jgi:hypothetical protein
MPEADTVNPSSSDTEEVLDLLFLSPACGHHSLALNLHLGSDSDAFEDWLKANDMAASVYVALTTDALSSRVSTIHVSFESLVLAACLADSLVRGWLRRKSLTNGKLH